jgi:hypothetical protein
VPESSCPRGSGARSEHSVTPQCLTDARMPARIDDDFHVVRPHGQWISWRPGALATGISTPVCPVPVEIVALTGAEPGEGLTAQQLAVAWRQQARISLSGDENWPVVSVEASFAAQVCQHHTTSGNLGSRVTA